MNVRVRMRPHVWRSATDVVFPVEYCRATPAGVCTACDVHRVTTCTVGILLDHLLEGTYGFFQTLLWNNCVLMKTVSRREEQVSSSVAPVRDFFPCVVLRKSLFLIVIRQTNRKTQLPTSQMDNRKSSIFPRKLLCKAIFR
jgi:hypothetical protein